MTDKSTGRGARSQAPAAIAARARLEAWTRAYSFGVIDAVVHYRDQRGMTNANLLERLVALGWDLTPNTLAGILSKKRKTMPFTDVMLFALALNVPPVALLFKTYEEPELTLAPTSKQVRKPYQATKWFTGTFPVLEGHEASAEALDERQSTREYYEVADTIWQAEEIEETLGRFLYAHAVLVLSLRENDDNAPAALEKAQGLLEQLASARRDFAYSHPGAGLPPLPEALGFVDRPRREWAEMPLADLTGEDVILQVLQVRDLGNLAPRSALDALEERTRVERDRRLEEGTSGGKA